MQNLNSLRRAIPLATYADPQKALAELREIAALPQPSRGLISQDAAALVQAIRAQKNPGLLEVFLAEYGLSTDEGIALMCLAEALLRVPDAPTVDALIEDKIAPSNWGKHLGQAASSLVNASTWALMFTGRVLEPNDVGIAGVLRGAVKRLGEPVIRTAVKRGVKEMARQFVLGETIEGALARGAAMVAKGYSYSFDMLGEAALTEADALAHFEHYATAISTIGSQPSPQAGAGISVKLSALFSRYEPAQKARVMATLLPRVKSLAMLAKANNMGFNIDAEEAARLDLSLDIIEALMRDSDLDGWDGFGVVVQAYGPRARHVIDWLAGLATEVDRHIMVRLVKGAYWDTEIKNAQELGLAHYAVFTTKSATDISYIACARRLFAADKIFPQFATHNAHTIAAVRHLAPKGAAYEFQRLHGMGENLHEENRARHGTACRIYAPVGTHRDLLAYLVRRLLENGANSSFVNQVVDLKVPVEEVVADPFDMRQPDSFPTGDTLFEPERTNSVGFDFDHAPDLARIVTARDTAAQTAFVARPSFSAGGAAHAVPPPFAPETSFGTVHNTTEAEVETALHRAALWDAPLSARQNILNRAADLYEENIGPLFALLTHEGGKTLADCQAELREAVDFLRYYAAQASANPHPAVGRIACISPWNFPLAIFTGQIAAALATGNGVLAKPAEDTPLVAAFAVSLLHQAGVPSDVLQLLPGTGASVGRALTSDPRIDGVCFTGSTATAKIIQSTMAAHLTPGAPLIAETGGLNAMIVDSTALLEQAVGDVIASAFQSAGQRCSALRCIYVQAEIAEAFKTMLMGAMDMLVLGDPANFATDIGPVIGQTAQASITGYIDEARVQGRVLKELSAPEQGSFVPPTLIATARGLRDMPREIFGPVLHFTTFAASEFDRVLEDINQSGYGLTFGLHSRIDSRVAQVQDKLHVGNLYVNRNQIGAIVGSQPFGGEGLSGTGPKAGGPRYLARFTRRTAPLDRPKEAPMLPLSKLSAPENAARLAPAQLPGPTGEANTLWTVSRDPILCLGPSLAAQKAQASAVRALGGRAICGHIAPQDVTPLEGISGALYWGEAHGVEARAYAQALAQREGPILPLITAFPDAAHALHERHLCVDTTAAGGNAALLAEGG